MRKIFVVLACAFNTFLFSQGGNTNQGPGSTTITPGGGRVNETQIDKTATQTPTTIITKFNKQFPGTRPKWKVEGNNFQATYTDRKTQLQNIVVYDKEGNMIRKESQLDPVNYPPAVVEYYKKNKAPEKYSVWQTEDQQGHKGYYGSQNNKIQWFDESGEIIIRRKKNLPAHKEEKQIRQGNQNNK
jgi:hypothetical protein